MRSDCRTPDAMRQHLKDFSVPITETGCHIWLGGLGGDGYGQVSYMCRPARAHRLSYMLNVGPLIPGKVIMHSCDEKTCINPRHLSQGTTQSNTADRDIKGRHRVASGENHYLRRNPKARAGEKSAAAKLTTEIVHEIRALLGLVTQEDIAKLFKISRTAVSAISTRRNWNHI